MKIRIDGDSCPVLDITIVLGRLLNKEVIVYSTMDNFTKNKGVEHIRCKSGKDSVDYKILTDLQRRDIVVTQDQGLASLCLIKEAVAINEYGFVFSKQFFLEKNIHICLRTGKQPKREIKDDVKFIRGFLNLLRLNFLKSEDKAPIIFLDNPSKAIMGIALAIGTALGYPVKILTKKEELHQENPQYTLFIQDCRKKEEGIFQYMRPGDIVVTKDNYLALYALQNGAYALAGNQYIYRMEDFEITCQRGENVLINREKVNPIHEQDFAFALLSYCGRYTVQQLPSPLEQVNQYTWKQNITSLANKEPMSKKKYP